MPADVEKEEVGDDDEQRGDADDELYQQFRRVGEMSLDGSMDIFRGLDMLFHFV